LYSSASWQSFTDDISSADGVLGSCQMLLSGGLKAGVQRQCASKVQSFSGFVLDSSFLYMTVEFHSFCKCLGQQVRTLLACSTILRLSPFLTCKGQKHRTSPAQKIQQGVCASDGLETFLLQGKTNENYFTTKLLHESTLSLARSRSCSRSRSIFLSLPHPRAKSG
jgi:hypothetical protein